MRNTTENATQAGISRIAGFSYLAIIAAGILSHFVIRGSLIKPDDAEATVQNIMDAETLFRISIAGDIVMLLFDVIVGVALFMLFRSVSPGLAILATSFRIVHAAVYGATLLSLIVIAVLVRGTSNLSASETALVQTFADVHALGYAMALVFFAFSLLAVGYLVLKSGAVPAIIGGLLAFAGAGYLLDSFAQILLTNYADYEDVLGVVVFLPAIIGELSFALWLLVKGIPARQQSDTPSRSFAATADSRAV
ncbi:MAG: DUF4386 domain-containing protein [Dehalococcoidia bacterium]